MSSMMTICVVSAAVFEVLDVPCLLLWFYFEILYSDSLPTLILALPCEESVSRMRESTLKCPIRLQTTMICIFLFPVDSIRGAGRFLFDQTTCRSQYHMCVTVLLHVGVSVFVVATRKKEANKLCSGTRRFVFHSSISHDRRICNRFVRDTTTDIYIIATKLQKTL